MDQQNNPNCDYCGRRNVAPEASHVVQDDTIVVSYAQCGPNEKGYCLCCGITYKEISGENSLDFTEKREQ